MLKRILTALALVSVVIGFLWLGAKVSYLFLDGFILLFATIGMYEMYKSLKIGGHPAMISPLIITVVCAYPCWYFFDIYGLLAVLAVSLLAGMIEFTFDLKKGIDSIFATIFALIYPYFFLSLAFVLTKNYCALFAIAFAVFVPSMTDTFAYFVGSQLGKHKLCPAISPKKTIEGAIGGLIGGIVTSVVFFLLFEYFAVFGDVGYVNFTSSVGWSVVIYIALGIVGGVLSQAGDLFASRVKRQLGIKDYGNIFPGHGGALDRADSIIYMLALLFIVFQFIY